MTWVVFAILALLLLACAFWLFEGVRTRNKKAAFAERVGQLGRADAVDEYIGLRHSLQEVKNPLTRFVCHQFWAAGVDVSPRRVNLWLLAGVVVFIVLLLVSPALAVLLAIAVALLGYLLLRQRVNSRRRRINAQMPDYLEYVLRSLTTGHSLEDALQDAALESSDPIRTLFLSISRQVRLGASIEDTLVEAGQVHRLQALRIMGMAARVNRRYGGSMRRIVKSLAGTIRRQDTAARELKALTGETRFSAWVVAAIPIGISIYFYLHNPGYYDSMLVSLSGRLMLAGVVVLLALGLFIIWRMVASVGDVSA